MKGRSVRQLAWLLLALPALVQLVLLASAVLPRLLYPYDLEWMEGGLLSHAARIANQDGIYVEPSVEFIPYLYTPLYPGLVAVLGSLFGISYQLGRAISVLLTAAVVGLAIAAVVREAADDDQGAGWAGGALAAGLFAAAYPWFDGWYDSVRADTLFLALTVGGLLAVRAWAKAGTGWPGQLRIGAAAAVLAMSFFCKQTGVLFVAAGGAMLLVLNWRRLPTYVGVAGLLGLGGTWLIDRASGGWFWVYVFKVHQAHDFNLPRFEDSFGFMLWKFPAATALIAVALAMVAVTAAMNRALPRSAGGLLVWSWIYAVALLAGALGWATQWAHNNAYMPAIATGAIAAGAAVPALAGCAAAWPRAPRWLPASLAVVAALAIGGELAHAWWKPGQFVPTARDRAAGDRLIARIRAIDGEVFIPFHPWYAALAGKHTYVHRMGVLDVSYGGKWKVRGLREALRNDLFAAVILDNRPVAHELPGLEASYRMDDTLPSDQAPRMYSGARVVPKSIWVPARPLQPPPDARVLFNFEDGLLAGWKVDGVAWGKRPEARPVAQQGQVRRYGGRYFVTSMHGGDAATGRLESPEFTIEGARLTFRLGGGRDAKKLRVDLRAGDHILATATASNSERLEDREWDVAAHQGKKARLVLTDDAIGPWGHLNFDELWMWTK